MVIHAGPFADRRECQRDLRRQLVTAVREYVDAHFSHRGGSNLEMPLDFIEQHLVGDRYEATRKESFGPLANEQPMFEAYALLRFSPAANQHLDELYRQVIVRQRLWLAGAGLAAVLLVLSAAWAGLRRSTTAGEPGPHVMSSAHGIVVVLALTSAETVAQIVSRVLGA